MNLERFIAALGPAQVAHRAPVDVLDLAYDTRAVTPGALFFCVRGASADGHAFAPTAAAAGAVALVVEQPLEVELPQLVVPDVRQAMPRAATLFFGEPTSELAVAGVTGTNGKTTTAFLLHAILDAAGRRPGLLTNIERRVGGQSLPTGTEHAGGDRPPAALPGDARRRRPELRDGGDVDRAGAGTTRRDTLRRSRLHEPDAGPPRLPRDDGGLLRGEAAPLRPGRARGRQRRRRVRPAPRRELPDAITFDAESRAIDGIDLKLRGRFNRENAIGAALAARALGVDDDAIRRGLESVRGVPGRFEAIDEGQGFAVIVDYAHTPDSLENVLRARATSARAGWSSSSAPVAAAIARSAR